MPRLVSEAGTGDPPPPCLLITQSPAFSNRHACRCRRRCGAGALRASQHTAAFTLAVRILPAGGSYSIPRSKSVALPTELPGQGLKGLISCRAGFRLPCGEKETPLKGLKIGLLNEFFDGLEARAAALIEEALKIYRRLGAETVGVSLPSLPLSVPTYYVVAPAECSSNLSRFDGVRFGYRCEEPRDLLDLYKRSRGEGFGAEVKRRIMTGTYVLSAGYYDAYYLKAQKARQRIADDFRAAFDQVDLSSGRRRRPRRSPSAPRSTTR